MRETRGLYHRQAERWEGAKRSLARQGIPDANLIEALWEVDIGLVREGDGAIGEGKRENGGAYGSLARANANASSLLEDIMPLFFDIRGHGLGVY